MLVISLAVVQWVRDPWEFTARVYHRRLPQAFTTGGYCGEFTMGVYCRRLLWEVNTGVYCGRLPSEFTLGDYHGSLPLGVKGPTLFVLGYHWLLLPTIDLMGNNREFEVWGIFEVLYWLWVVDSLRTLKVHHCLSLVTIGSPSNHWFSRW